ncbi:hypothetical protein KP22_18565 [Pectobacterium betavasculorum]|uniref:Uncharacterized protein n=1 Tax=Pectobacterium betavasculorum TaxID=55207 RepID=A0A093RXE9_9GAMM|nr:hypothetical protein KP22_18565 [Pectobacterium betavasculorum]
MEDEAQLLSGLVATTCRKICVAVADTSRSPAPSRMPVNTLILDQDDAALIGNSFGDDGPQFGSFEA